MKSYKTIDEYIKNSPKHVQAVLKTLRATIKKAAPEATETIKYGIPTFVLNGNLVHFGGYEKHIGFYPTPDGISDFKRELSKFEGGKGTVKFPIDKPLPLGLITKIVKLRIRQNKALMSKKLTF